MRTRNRIFGTAAVAFSLLIGLFATGTAQAADDGGKPAADRTLTAPAEPNVGTLTAAGVAATSPRISPSANYIHVAPGNSYTCEYKNLCTQVWDPVYGKWKVFKLFYCNTYSLSYWNNYGAYINNQTSGAKAYFYNSSGVAVRTSTAYGYDTSFDWGPIWKIKNC